MEHSMVNYSKMEGLLGKMFFSTVTRTSDGFGGLNLPQLKIEGVLCANKLPTSTIRIAGLKAAAAITIRRSE